MNAKMCWAAMMMVLACCAVEPLSAQEPKLRATLADNGWVVSSVAFSPNGKLLASSNWDKVVKLWDAETSKETAILKGNAKLFAVAFSPNSRMVASGSIDNTITIWEVPIGKETATLRGHTKSVSCVAFNPGPYQARKR